MSGPRVYVIAALCLAILTAASVLSIGAQRHYPLVQVHLPDKSTLTFVDAPWTDLKKCLDANKKIISAIAKNCSQCQIEESCAGQLDIPWQMALSGQKIDRYVVQSGTLRIVVDAASSSRQTCMAMAEQITSEKKQIAYCLPSA